MLGPETLRSELSDKKENFEGPDLRRLVLNHS